MLVLLVSCGERHRVEIRESSSAEAFLTAWLVDQKLDATRAMFTPEFDQSPAIDADKFPETLKSLSRSERALRYPQLAGCTIACESLSACIEAASGSSAPFRAEEVEISTEMASRFSDLRPHTGRKGQLVTFLFRDCNVATTIVVLDDAKRPVAMIGFIAEVEE